MSRPESDVIIGSSVLRESVRRSIQGEGRRRTPRVTFGVTRQVQPESHMGTCRETSQVTCWALSPRIPLQKLAFKNANVRV